MRQILRKFKRMFNLLIAILFYDERSVVKLFRKQGAQIGNDCSIVPHSLGEEPYLVKIGNHVTIAGGTTFITHDGAAWIGRLEIPDLQVFGPIIIGNNCVIGQDVLLCPNIKIGDNCIVGAGSVVITDIPSNSLVMGVPARPIGSLEKYKDKCINHWKEQKPSGIMIEPGHNWWNSKYYNKNRKLLRKHLTQLFWGRDPGQKDRI